MMLRSLPLLLLRCTSRNVNFIKLSTSLSTLPAHRLVPMPSLSPTMEAGSIAKWFLKEGDSFEPGQAMCEVETDKATVTYDASEEGFLAKILVGAGEVKVGQPLMITVEEKSFVPAFATYNSPITVTSAAKTSNKSHTSPDSSVILPNPVHPVTVASSGDGGRIVASPLAKKMARESAVDLHAIGIGSGPSGRIIANDVLLAAAAAVSKPRAEILSSHSQPIVSTTSISKISEKVTKAAPSGVLGVYSDFELTDIAQAVAQRLTQSKQSIPHYYLSVDLDLTRLLKLRGELNASSGKSAEGLSVLDLLVKAVAHAVSTVPDVNASWMDTFVRRYEQVDINIVMGTGSALLTPVIKNVGSKGLKAISAELTSFEDALYGDNNGLDTDKLAMGTFSIHNLGIYGVKAAAPIILPPQACALALGAIVDTVVPRENSKEGEDNWRVAPVMTVTLSCDHRVIDGAVGAQWLSAFKIAVENPITMIL